MIAALAGFISSWRTPPDLLAQTPLLLHLFFSSRNNRDGFAQSLNSSCPVSNLHVSCEIKIPPTAVKQAEGQRDSIVKPIVSTKPIPRELSETESRSIHWPVPGPRHIYSRGLPGLASVGEDAPQVSGERDTCWRRGSILS